MTNYIGNSLLTLKKNNKGRVSALTPVKASITVEAVMSVPLFLFAVICMIYLFEITVIGTSIQSGLQYAGKKVMQNTSFMPVISEGEVESDIIHAIGAERMDRSIIVNGSRGIDCSKSRMSLRTGIGELIVEYKIRIPVPVFYRRGIAREESIRIKAWNGYEKNLPGMENDQVVYVTENGLVYHKDYHCTYLDLSIRMVKGEEVEQLRNESGGRYTACRWCETDMDTVYITDNGSKYHGTLSCSGLKRTVYAVPLLEVIGKGACTRCGK